MARTQTGPMVRTNGRMVSLAELDVRSNASNTATVPYSSSASPTASNAYSLQFTVNGMVDLGSVFS